jgi:hypothetical protein
MTLPQGFKTFTDGTVLTADEINGYLQQGILVFDDASERTTALTGNLREGMYSYLKSDNTTYVYDGTAWQRVGKQDVETEKNFQAFTGSGGTTVPAWATKMYYLVVAGGRPSSSTSGGAGGAVVEGNTTVTGGTSLTVTIGGSNANSSLAVAGGSTFTASGAGAAGGGANTNGTNGPLVLSPFAIGRIAGGGGGSDPSGFFGDANMGYGAATGGGTAGTEARVGQNGAANTGGGGGAKAPRGPGGASTGGSGLVLLYFS